MGIRLFAKLALGSFALIQGAATAIIDFNHTHATNPEWTGHARFHLVWQDLNSVMLALVEVGLLVWGRRFETPAFACAWILAAIPCCGFVLAQIGRSLYGGTLSDPNGIPPKRIRAGGSVVKLDGNAAAVYAGFAVLSAIAMAYAVAAH